jgi:hypothetical protein
MGRGTFPSPELSKISNLSTPEEKLKRSKCKVNVLL